MVDMTQQMNACFAALADPTRRAVVEALARAPASVSELHAPHNMALPTFMRHLSVLEKCGLVRSEKVGRVRTCFIEAAPLLQVQGWMEWQRIVVEKQIESRDQIPFALDP